PPRGVDVAPAQPNPVRYGGMTMAVGLFSLLLLLAYAITRPTGPELTLQEVQLPMPASQDLDMQARGLAGSAVPTARGVVPDKTAATQTISTTVSDAFVVPDGADGLEVELRSDLSSGWLGVEFTLVRNEVQAWTFSMEQDHFHDSASTPAAFGPRSSSTIGSPPPGQYVLRADARWARRPEVSLPAPTATATVRTVRGGSGF